LFTTVNVVLPVLLKRKHSPGADWFAGGRKTFRLDPVLFTSIMRAAIRVPFAGAFVSSGQDRVMSAALRLKDR
jgi:hypothetical protein